MLSILRTCSTTQCLFAVNILADASLPHLDTLFKAPCHLTTYKNNDELLNALPHHDVLLCRSTLRVTADLLINSKLKCVATASSGVDHIDVEYLKTQNIKLFDAKGCNAEAVSDYVLSTLAYLDTQHKLPGMRIGIMGAGEVGSRVSTRLQALGFKVFLYDPPKAHRNPAFISCSLEAFTSCDVLCIHANLHNTQPHPTRDFLNAEFLQSLRPHTVIINAARGGMLDEQALLNSKHPITYCTDVYQAEPQINPEIIHRALICTPHIAGHSIEAKSDAVLHISKALHQYFKLKPPATLTYPKITLNSLDNSWQARALAHYNPIHETLKLKQAQDKHAEFINLRRAHHNRHNFSQYI
ncbi:MAG: 4-phosphoerythronate dehydrogenase [Legionellaceae bacterium]|nr:4-phosphoerythronate dehydrogenase [Legionellaceae bacterium]